MPIQPTEFHRPQNEAKARTLLQRTEVRTAPLFLMPRPRPLWEPPAEAVVDLSQLELAYIRAGAGGGLHIGALTPLQDLVESPRLQSAPYALLARAARHTAHYGLRNAATVGGVISSAHEGPPEAPLALLALRATVVLQGEAAREVPWETLLRGEERPAAGEYVREVRLAPPASGMSAALERVTRSPQDAAIVAAAAVVQLSGGVIQQVWLAVAAPHPQRLPTVEDLLVGRAPAEALLEQAAEAVRSATQVAADFRASAEYRRAVVGVVARRALQAAWQQSGGSSDPL